MKNFVKLFWVTALAALIVFSITACQTTGTASRPAASVTQEPGILIITGLDEYNGKLIYAEGQRSDGGQIQAGAGVVDSENPMTGETGKAVTGGVIANGTATLQVLIWESSDLVRFNGNETVDLYLQVWEGPEIYHWHHNIATGRADVTFNNGSAEVVFVEVE